MTGREQIENGVGDRVVAVTGASQGLGHVLAEAFAAAGARVALLARSETALKLLADEITTRGGRALAVPCDITDGEGMTEAFGTIAAAWGGVDSVVANAGISPIVRRGQNVPAETWTRILTVNLTGSFLTAQAAYPYLAASGRGRFVANTSVMARRPRPGLSAYAASKAGLEGLTKALAVDWAPDGICVNAVAPGFFDSPLAAGLRSDERREREITDHTLLRRWGHHDDLPGAFLFLASDAASYLTGQVLTVDGGYELS